MDPQPDTKQAVLTFKAHNCMTNVIETAVIDRGRQVVDMSVQTHLQKPDQPGWDRTHTWVQRRGPVEVQLRAAGRTRHWTNGQATLGRVGRGAG